MKKQIKRFAKWALTGLGIGRHCPICGNRTMKFRAHGNPPRSDARCPICGGVERHRLFWLYLERQTEFLKNPPERILHVAPERVIEEKFRATFKRGYVTADLFREDVDLKLDITQMDCPDDSFDFIYCSHVLEHVPDDRQAMREFRRVLKPGGLAILLVPVTADKTFEDPSITDPAERLRLFGQEDHVRRYGPDYQERLEEAGFKVDCIRPRDFLSKFEIRTMGITPAAGDLYVCRL